MNHNEQQLLTEILTALNRIADSSERSARVLEKIAEQDELFEVDYAAE